VPHVKTEKRKLPGFPLQSFAGWAGISTSAPCQRPWVWYLLQKLHVVLFLMEMFTTVQHYKKWEICLTFSIQRY